MPKRVIIKLDIYTHDIIRLLKQAKCYHAVCLIPKLSLHATCIRSTAKVAKAMDNGMASMGGLNVYVWQTIHEAFREGKHKLKGLCNFATMLTLVEC